MNVKSQKVDQVAKEVILLILQKEVQEIAQEKVIPEVVKEAILKNPQEVVIQVKVQEKVIPKVVKEAILKNPQEVVIQRKVQEKVIPDPDPEVEATQVIHQEAVEVVIAVHYHHLVHLCKTNNMKKNFKNLMTKTK